jgi:hypothetical protein
MSHDGLFTLTLASVGSPPAVAEIKRAARYRVHLVTAHLPPSPQRGAVAQTQEGTPWPPPSRP